MNNADPRPDYPGDLGDLLEAAVADVQPRGSLDEIRTLTARATRRRRRSRWAATGAAAAVAATVAGTLALSGLTATGGDAGFSGTTRVASPATRTVPVYYVGATSHGPRLFQEPHVFPAASATRRAVDEAVSARPKDPDYRQVWPAGTTVGPVRLHGTGDHRVITVDLRPGRTPLSERPAGMPGQVAAEAVQQVVHTAQAGEGSNAPVRLLIGGRPVTTVLGEPADTPLAADDSALTLAQVWIIAPGQASTVHSPFRVHGLGASFEGNLQWKLERGGRVVRRGFVTTARCCTMAPYSFSVAAPPGRYTLVVSEGEATRMEGPAPYRDSKAITIVGRHGGS